MKASRAAGSRGVRETSRLITGAPGAGPTTELPDGRVGGGVARRTWAGVAEAGVETDTAPEAATATNATGTDTARTRRRRRLGRMADSLADAGSGRRAAPVPGSVRRCSALRPR